MWSLALASKKRRQAGQTVYVTLLVLAAVFLGVAIAFPTYEYISRRYWEKPPVVTVTPMEFNLEEILSKTSLPDAAEAPDKPATEPAPAGNTTGE